MLAEAGRDSSSQNGQQLCLLKDGSRWLERWTKVVADGRVLWGRGEQDL